MKAESSRVDADRREVGDDELASPERQPSAAWLARGDAAKVLGVAYGTFRRLEERRDIVGAEVNGVVRFDPEEVEELRERRAAGGGPGAGEQLGAAAVMREIVAALKATHAREERLFDQFIGPLERHSDRLLKRVDELEAKNSAMIEASEKALSLEHERKLAEHNAKVADARKDRVIAASIDGAKAIGPALFGRLVAGVSAPSAAPAPPAAPTPTSAPQTTPAGEEELTPDWADAQAVYAAIGELSDMHLAALRATGAMAPDKLAALERVRAGIRAAQEREAAAGEAPTPGSVE
jgi:hypothetical protein